MTELKIDLGVKNDDTAIIKSIIGKDELAPKLRPILGAAPSLQQSLEAEKELRIRNGFYRARRVLLGVFTLCAMASFYLYADLNPQLNFFGFSTAAQVVSINEDLKAAQTQLNKFRYLSAQADLNDFSYKTDQYFDKIAQIASMAFNDEEKAKLKADLLQLQAELPDILKRIKENLGNDITVKTFALTTEDNVTPEVYQTQFEALLRTELTDYKNSLTQNRNINAEGAKNAAQDSEEVKLIDNTLKLVGNTDLITAIKAVSLDEFKKGLTGYQTETDPVKKKVFRDLVAQILSSTKSQISSVSALKQTRMAFTKIISQIEAITLSVYPSANKDVFDASGISLNYTGYDFDAPSGKIVLSGETKTKDAKNFSLITKLLDQLEESAYFKNVQSRSFSKNGDDSSGYSASFRIELQLETDPNAGKKINNGVSVISPLVKKQTGVKRLK